MCGWQLWTYDIDYALDYFLMSPEEVAEFNANGARSPTNKGADENRVTKTDIQVTHMTHNQSRAHEALGAHFSLFAPFVDERVVQQPVVSHMDSVKGGMAEKEPVPDVYSFEYGASRYSPALFSTCPDMRKLRHKMDHGDLMAQWESSIAQYVKGEWPQAIAGFQSFQAAFKEYNEGEEDGPAGFLVDFMQNTHNGQAPADWKGIRD